MNTQQLSGQQNNPLHAAVASGNLEQVKKLIENQNQDVNELNSSGFSAFAIAVQRGYAKICQYLVNNGAKTNYGKMSLRLLGDIQPLFRHLYQDDEVSSSKEDTAYSLYTFYCQDKYIPLPDYDVVDEKNLTDSQKNLMAFIAKTALLLLSEIISIANLKTVRAAISKENPDKKDQNVIKQYEGVINKKLFDHLDLLIYAFMEMKEPGIIKNLVEEFGKTINPNQLLSKAGLKVNLAYYAVKCNFMDILTAFHKHQLVDLDNIEMDGYVLAAHLITARHYETLKKLYPENKNINFNAKIPAKNPKNESDVAIVTIGYLLLVANQFDLLPFNNEILSNSNSLDPLCSRYYFNLDGNAACDHPKSSQDGVTIYYYLTASKMWKQYEFLLDHTPYNSVNLKAIPKNKKHKNIELIKFLFLMDAPIALICKTFLKKIQSGWTEFDFNFKPYGDYKKKNLTFFTILLQADDMRTNQKQNFIEQFLPYQNEPIDFNAEMIDIEDNNRILKFYPSLFDSDYIQDRCVSYKVLERNFELGWKGFDFNHSRFTNDRYNVHYFKESLIAEFPGYLEDVIERKEYIKIIKLCLPHQKTPINLFAKDERGCNIFDAVFFNCDISDAGIDLTASDVIINILNKNLELGWTGLNLNYGKDDRQEKNLTRNGRTLFWCLIALKDWRLLGRAVTQQPEIINLKSAPCNPRHPEVGVTALQKLYIHDAPFKLVQFIFKKNIELGFTQKHLIKVDPSFQWLFDYAKSYSGDPLSLEESVFFEKSQSLDFNQAFRQAAAQKNIDDLEKLIQHGKVDLNHQDTRGCTALHSAIQNGKIENACYLLWRKADFSIVDRDGKTAVDYAIAAKCMPVLNFMKTIVCYNYRQNHLHAVLKQAKEKNDVEVIKLIKFYQHDNAIAHRAVAPGSSNQ